MRARRRWWLAGAGLVACTVGCGLLSSVLLSAAAGERWLAHRLEAAVGGATEGGELDIGRLSLGHQGIVLRDVRLRDRHGSTLLVVDRAGASLDVRALLLDRRVVLPVLRVDGVDVRVAADNAGVVDWSSLFGSGGGGGFSLPFDFEVAALEVDGVRVGYRTPLGSPLQLTAGHVSARVSGRGDRVTLRDTVASAQLAKPGPVPIMILGDLAFDGDSGLRLDQVTVALPRGRLVTTGTLGAIVSLGATVERMELTSLDPFVGEIGLKGTLSGSLHLKGPRDRTELAVALQGIEGTDGAVSLTGTVDLAAEVPAWSLFGQLSGVRLDELYAPVTRPTLLDGLVRVEGVGTSPRSDLALDATWVGKDNVFWDLPVDTVDAALQVRGGLLEIVKGEVEGVLGAMQLGGSVDLAGGGLELTVESPLDPERLAALGTAGLTGQGVVVAEVVMRPGDPVVRITGTARYAPFRYGPDVTVRSLVAPFHCTVEAGVVAGAVDLQGQGLAAVGLTGASLDADDLAFERTPAGRTTVRGRVDVGGVAYTENLLVSATRTDVRFVLDGGHRSGAFTTELGPWSTFDLPGTHGTLTTGLVDQEVRFDADLRDGTRAAVAATGRFGLGDGSLFVSRLGWAPTPRTTWVAPRGLRGTVVDGGLHDTDARFVSPLGRIDLSGDLSASGPLDGRIVLQGFELDHLTELWPDRFDVSGRLDLDLRLTGTGESPIVDGDVDLVGLFANGSVRWLDVAGGFRWAGGRLLPDLRLSVAQAPFARVSGEIPVLGGLTAPTAALDGPLALRVAFEPGGLDRLVHLSPSLDGRELPDGRWSAELRLDGALRDPAAHLAGVAELDLVGFTSPGRLEFVLDRVEDQLVFGGDLREDLALRGTASGTATTRVAEVFAAFLAGGPPVTLSEPTLWVDDLDVSTALVGVPVGGLASAGGLPVPLGGELVGGFLLTGSPMKPVVDGAVNWVEASLGDQAFDGAYLALTPTATGYSLAAAGTFPGGGSLEVSGDLPVAVDLASAPELWGTGPLTLAIDGFGVPLSLLTGLDSNLRDAEGRLVITGTVGGGLTDPDPHLVVVGEGLAGQYRALGLATVDPQVRFELTRDALLFDVHGPTTPARRFQAVLGEGLDVLEEPWIDASGRIGLAGWEPTDLDATVALRHGAWLAATDLTRFRWNGDLRLSGPWDHRRVTGSLELVQGQVGLEAASFVDASPLELAPELQVSRSTSVQVQRTPEEPPFYAAFDVDVQVDLKRNLQLDMSIPFVDDFGDVAATVARVDVSTRLGGQVDLSLDAGAPQLVGELQLVDGGVRLLRANFDIDEGTLTFAGGDPYEDVELDVRATMPVSGAELDLHLTGTPIEPQFVFHSELFPDPNEQMVVLLTGTAPDELTSDEGAGALSLAMLLWSSITSGTRMGSFSIEPDGAVRLQLPVSRAIHASSTWSPLSDPTSNSVAFEVDWSVLPHLVANGGVGDRISWGDLYWELRF